jgi:flagellar secretion chaperone FliS
MQATMARAAQAYHQTHVRSQSPVELVVLLYDGALRFMRLTRDAIDGRDLVGKREALSRAMAIMSELQNSLNMEAGGDIARSLDGLYDYIIARLTDANVHNTTEPVDEAVRLMSVLREGWAQIAVPGFLPPTPDPR